MTNQTRCILCCVFSVSCNLCHCLQLWSRQLRIVYKLCLLVYNMSTWAGPIISVISVRTTVILLWPLWCESVCTLTRRLTRHDAFCVVYFLSLAISATVFSFDLVNYVSYTNFACSSTICQHELAQSYLSSLCAPLSAVTTRRHLRAATQSDLDFPRTRTVTFGSRAFAVSGPICWNALPPSLKSPSLKPWQFCSLLKTTLMAQPS